eukprot:CAMPEP_0178451442 /NCGR_PEP_ID=MMETSP0689_2-20121128/43690_1 /TAXON_ID=160604 /ORGANISM="Amphidinium massartii, Strain CS-259" /LENGTH=1243 /DNA_ID=CAMNT_0020077035 /DNA_START=21 /DNA_END=3748 /DNA_ORIENTATION=+
MPGSEASERADVEVDDIDTNSSAYGHAEAGDVLRECPPETDSSGRSSAPGEHSSSEDNVESPQSRVVTKERRRRRRRGSDGTRMSFVSMAESSEHQQPSEYSPSPTEGATFSNAQMTTAPCRTPSPLGNFPPSDSLEAALLRHGMEVMKLAAHIAQQATDLSSEDEVGDYERSPSSLSEAEGDDPVEAVKPASELRQAPGSACESLSTGLGSTVPRVQPGHVLDTWSDTTSAVSAVGVEHNIDDLFQESSMFASPPRNLDSRCSIAQPLPEEPEGSESELHHEKMVAEVLPREGPQDTDTQDAEVGQGVSEQTPLVQTCQQESSSHADLHALASGMVEDAVEAAKESVHRADLSMSGFSQDDPGQTQHTAAPLPARAERHVSRSMSECFASSLASESSTEETRKGSRRGSTVLVAARERLRERAEEEMAGLLQGRGLTHAQQMEVEEQERRKMLEQKAIGQKLKESNASRVIKSALQTMAARLELKRLAGLQVEAERTAFIEGRQQGRLSISGGRADIWFLIEDLQEAPQDDDQATASEAGKPHHRKAGRRGTTKQREESSDSSSSRNVVTYSHFASVREQRHMRQLEAAAASPSSSTSMGSCHGRPKPEAGSQRGRPRGHTWHTARKEQAPPSADAAADVDADAAAAEGAPSRKLHRDDAVRKVQVHHGRRPRYHTQRPEQVADKLAPSPPSSASNASPESVAKERAVLALQSHLRMCQARQQLTELQQVEEESALHCLTDEIVEGAFRDAHHDMVAEIIFRAQSVHRTTPSTESATPEAHLLADDEHLPPTTSVASNVQDGSRWSPLSSQYSARACGRPDLKLYLTAMEERIAQAVQAGEYDIKPPSPRRSPRDSPGYTLTYHSSKQEARVAAEVYQSPASAREKQRRQSPISPRPAVSPLSPRSPRLPAGSQSGVQSKPSTPNRTVGQLGPLRTHRKTGLSDPDASSPQPQAGEDAEASKELDPISDSSSQHRLVPGVGMRLFPKSAWKLPTSQSRPLIGFPIADDGSADFAKVKAYEADLQSCRNEDTLLLTLQGIKAWVAAQGADDHEALTTKPARKPGSWSKDWVEQNTLPFRWVGNVTWDYPSQEDLSSEDLQADSSMVSLPSVLMGSFGHGSDSSPIHTASSDKLNLEAMMQNMMSGSNEAALETADSIPATSREPSSLPLVPESARQRPVPRIMAHSVPRPPTSARKLLPAKFTSKRCGVLPAVPVLERTRLLFDGQANSLEEAEEDTEMALHL